MKTFEQWLDSVAKQESAPGSLILGPIVEEAAGAKPGSKWAVVIIQEGVSRNRIEYPASVLREAAALYEGARVFWNHRPEEQSTLPDPRNTAGVIKGTRSTLLEGSGKTAVVGTLNVITAEARERLLEAHEAGALHAYGLSHTVHAETEKVRLADGPAHRAKRINVVESVDIVSFPSAGGRLMRLEAGMKSPVHATEEELLMLDKKIAKLREARPDLAGKLSATPTESEVDALLLEAVTPKAAEPPPAPPAPPAWPDAPQGLSDADRSLLAEIRESQKAIAIDRALQGVNLPAVALEALRESLKAQKDVTPDSAAAAVKAKVNEVARITESVRGIGYGAGVTVEAVQGGEGDEKALNLLDDLLFTDASAAAKAQYKTIAGREVGKPDTHSVKEAYSMITGDMRPYGKPLVRESLRDMGRFNGLMAKRLVEGRRLVESLLQTSTWAEVFGDSVARRMIAEYRSQPFINDWRILATVVPVNDFRTRHAIRWGGYNDLPTVAQAGTYQDATTPGDEEATYAATKRGYLESLTWEALVNDDLGQIRNIPVKMGRAAARTLYKFVTKDLCASNPTLDYDATLLFHANHSNAGSSALSAAQISVVRQKLGAQTDMSTNEKLNLFPSWLMVPLDLEETAWRLVNVPVANTTNQNATEPSYQRSLGLNTLIVNPYLTDANDWFVGADKSQATFIELGFLFGNEEPSIVIADQQQVGQFFDADKIRYKIRHVYGGDVVDHRPVFGALVA